MFDPRNFQPLNGVSEPTPDAKHREEYYSSRKANKTATRRLAKQPSVDVALLRAEFITRIGRYLRFA